MMLERSIIIVHSDPEIVSVCSTALVDLLDPFKWQGTFIPVLPEDMRDFMCSPVPFVIGMVGGEKVKQKAKEEGVVIVDLSVGEVIVHEEGLSEILPLASEFCVILGSLHCRLMSLASASASVCDHGSSASLLSLSTFIKRGLTNLESITVKSVRDAVRGHLQGLGGDICIGRNR